MKKILTMLLLFSLSLVIVACSNGENNGEEVPTELDTRLTDGLRLDRDPEGKNFFEDGIAYAELATCIDGDTTRFIVNGQNISVRYLAVDTPESTGAIEPWGFAASNFVCEILENAETIVLEAEVPNQTGNYGRHLGYVWYDGRLLNLELIELAYSSAQGVGGLKYADELRAAEEKARPTNLRIWGEEDPDYSDEAIIIDYNELYENRDHYIGKKITIEAYVSSVGGGTATLMNEDGENFIALYLANQISSKLTPCFKVQLEEVVPTYWFEQFQLTNFAPRRTHVLDNDTQFCD